MDIEQERSVDCADFEFNFTRTPDILSVADVHLLASLHQGELMTLFPLIVNVYASFILQAFFALVISCCFDVRAYCLINHFVLFKLLLPYVFPAHRARLKRK